MRKGSECGEQLLFSQDWHVIPLKIAGGKEHYKLTVSLEHNYIRIKALLNWTSVVHGEQGEKSHQGATLARIDQFEFCFIPFIYFLSSAAHDPSLVMLPAGKNQGILQSVLRKSCKGIKSHQLKGTVKVAALKYFTCAAIDGKFLQ